MKRILISAGDYSADIHGEALIRSLKKIQPDIYVAALGGGLIKKEATTFLKDMVGMEISGVTQPIKQFFKLKEILLQTVYPILEKREVDAVVLIDYYGFNIHVAQKAKKEGIPVFYFVSPQVWASRRWRIKKLKSCVTKMLVIFPFERDLYQAHGVPVEFVGHPIMNIIDKLKLGEANKPDTSSKIHLGLMPGSRAKEITRHLPIMIQTYDLLKKKHEHLEATVFAVDAIEDSLYLKYLNGTSIKLVRDADYSTRLTLTLSLTASGTATLENALLGIPMVVIYQASWLTYLVARLLIQIKLVSMANILSGKEVVPELLQHRAKPLKIARAISDIIFTPSRLERTREELVKLRKVLGKPGAYDRVATTILNQL